MRFAGVDQQCRLTFTADIKDIHDLAAGHCDAVGFKIIGEHAQAQIQHNNQCVLALLYWLGLFRPGRARQGNNAQYPYCQQQVQWQSLRGVFAGIEQVGQQALINHLVPGGTLRVQFPQTTEKKQSRNQGQQPQGAQKMEIGDCLCECHRFVHADSPPGTESRFCPAFIAGGMARSASRKLSSSATPSGQWNSCVSGR